MKKFAAIGTIILIHFNVFANETDLSKIQQSCLEIHQSWLALDLDLTKNTPGYSAPVAARSFLYITIAMTEASYGLIPSYNGYSGTLNEFDIPEIKLNHKASYEHIANYVNYKIALFYFSNTAPFEIEKIEKKFNQIKKTYNKNYSKIRIKRSENFANCIVEAIINWSNLDEAQNCWLKNFPADYEIKYCDSCWVKTFPGFVGALQPYWGQNRLSVKSNEDICNDIPYIPFSSEPKSDFYNEANEMNKVFEKFSKSQINTAKYWNDAPGVSGTPAGHLFAIALDLSKLYKTNLEVSLKLFSSLGIALNDAVIECWKLKYDFNLIRPVTYIHRYISEDFTTSIITPPFPEFPSGHSFQAGAGTEVLKHFFGDTLVFTDYTNQSRVDLDGAPRTYNTFSEMSEEMSISRFYGGIHYMSTLKVSLMYGRKIGINSILH
jgi:hypothetical protein